MNRQKGPPSRGRDGAGAKRSQQQRIAESVTVQGLADQLVLRCVEAERQFVAALWLDREAGYDAAVAAGLTVSTFSDRRLGFAFWYLCRCVEGGFIPAMGTCLTLAPRAEVPLDHLDIGWLYRLILGTDTEAGYVGHYAARLRRLSDIRDGRARAALGTFARLAVDESRFRITVTLLSAPLRRRVVA